MWCDAVRLVGNAVCVPIIVALGGAIVAQCPALQRQREEKEKDAVVDAAEMGKCTILQLPRRLIHPVHSQPSSCL